MYGTSASDTTQINLEELVTTATTQQQTLAYLLAKWDALLNQVVAFGTPTNIAVDFSVPVGVWYCTNPLTGQIGTTGTGANILPVGAPGPFASGTGTASVRVILPSGITVVQVQGIDMLALV